MGFDLVDSRFARYRDATVRASQDPVIRALAIKLAGLYEMRPSAELADLVSTGDGRALSTYQARQLLRAVQDRVEYVDTEEERASDHPIATWLRREGDCKMSAPLLAGLALSVGIPARLVAMGWDGEPSHVAAQLAPFGRWLWAETTIPGARLGEHPSAALERVGDGGRERADLVGVRGVPQGPAPNYLTHVYGRDIIVNAFVLELGRYPSQFERLLVQALCWQETNYGQGWAHACPACKDSHNWGSIHARTTFVGAYGLGFEVCEAPCCACSDSTPDGVRYRQPMRTYPDDVHGAAGVVELIYRHMGNVARALEKGSSVQDVATALFYDHYAGAYCPLALKRYGDAARESYAFPGFGKRATSEAGKACERECIAMITDNLFRNAKLIATALNEPAPSRESSSLLPWLLGAAVVGGVAFARRR